jgi:hypothetical protein
MVSFTDELKAKQQQVMGNIIDRGAKDLQGKLLAEVQKVAAKIPGSIVLGKPDGSKNKDTALAKVIRDYGGDWLSIKDMARCTLVVQSQIDYDAALRALRAYFVASNGFTVFEQKTTVGQLDDGGYSGSTVFVTSGGNKGEIQVNTPAMMYAKSLPEFRRALGNLEPLMKATYPLVPGGLGHALYVGFRNCKQTPIGRSYMAASKLYYNYFRSSPPNMNWGMMAKAAIDKLHLVHH